jgi:hypothetical protein
VEADCALLSGGVRRIEVGYGELERLFQQFFALVETTIRLPLGSKRQAAFRYVRDCGARIDQIATRFLKQDGN